MTAMMAEDSGSANWKKKRVLPQPSSLAASISSNGMLVLKKVLATIILYTPIAPGMISAHMELRSPVCLTMR